MPHGYSFARKPACAALALLMTASCITCSAQRPEKQDVSLIVLGTIQDGGAPHAGCKKNCCRKLFRHPDPNLQVVSLGVVDHAADKVYLLEASPDFARQIKTLRGFAQAEHSEVPDGIFLTHAHIGHYTGLMYLGREAAHTANIPVYAMPRMGAFLEQNGPWSQLVKLNNISLQPLKDGQRVLLTNRLSITPLTVPHRDEFSETVGFIISGPNKKALFIPDIDKWSKWTKDIREVISKVDYAFIDGAFYDAVEIGNRDLSTIPHPFIVESMRLFADLPIAEKNKVYFIHFNHTNPVINKRSPQYKEVLEAGFHVAAIGTEFVL